MSVMIERLIVNPKMEIACRYFIYFVLLLPLLIFRDYTPANELGYISIADEALRNHTWFTFYTQGEIYADKPPLYLWLVMLSKLTTGGYHMWIIGTFSLLPALGILVIMDRWFRYSGIEHHPLSSNVLLMTTAFFVGPAILIRMDMLMAFFIVLSLYTFYRIYSNRHTKAEPYLLPVYIFLAVFTKGPIGILFPLASILGFLTIKKQLRTFGRYLGWRQWLIMLALFGAWFTAVYIEGGNEYLNNLLVKQTIGRGINTFHHKEPFWYYFPRMLMTFAPWSPLYLILLWLGIRKKLFTTDLHRFFAVTITVNLLLLSLISSKLDVYLLPLYPFIVYLCAAFLTQLKDEKSVKFGIGISVIIFILLFPALILFGDQLAEHIKGLLPYIGIGILSVTSLLALRLLLRCQVRKAIVYTGFGMLLMFFVVSFAIPQVNHHIGFKELAHKAKITAQKTSTEKFYYYNYQRIRNMDVYLGNGVEPVRSISKLDSIDRAGQPAIVFIREKDVRREQALREWIDTQDGRQAVGSYSWYVIGDN